MSSKLLSIIILLLRLETKGHFDLNGTMIALWRDGQNDIFQEQ